VRAALAQAGQEHDVTIRKFDCIVVGIGIIQIDLTKPSKLVAVFDRSFLKKRT
jgi:hypothetical protein